jgi:signal peptidase II
VSQVDATSGPGAVDAAVVPASQPARASRARRWAVFFGLAGGVIVVDQVVKAWVVGSFTLGVPVDVIGEWVRIWYVQNTGALFGLFRDQAVLFAALSIGVMGLIVWYHGRAMTGYGWLATVALGLLLGGAVGNFIDRARLGYVVDFVDMGIPGGWRFYTWNVADAAITTSILLLLLMVILPQGHRETPAG